MVEEDQIKLIKRELQESFKTEFENIENPNVEKTSNNQELSTNGLYRIEPIDLFKGGPLQWGHKYRIRHLISGKYLCCFKLKRVNSNHRNRYELRLTKQRDDTTLFKFIPIENLMYKYQSKQNVQKDSFFRIQHTNNDEIVWLSTKEDDEEDTTAATNLLSEKQFSVLQSFISKLFLNQKFFNLQENNHFIYKPQIYIKE